MSSNGKSLERITRGMEIDASTDRGLSNDQLVEEDDDYTSSSGSSSEDEDEQPTEQSQATSNTKKPPEKFQPNNELKSRLKEFLPQFERANQELEAMDDTTSQNIEARDDETVYVEMDLALGVLTEQRQGDDTLKTRDDDDGSGSEIDTNTNIGTRNVFGTRVNVQPDSAKKPKIQEI